MPPRKGHRKTRTGCVMCKRRRIKCDETRPQCRNCTMHGKQMECAYLDVIPTRKTSRSLAMSLVFGEVNPPNHQDSGNSASSTHNNEINPYIPFTKSITMQTHNDKELCANCGCWHRNLTQSRVAGCTVELGAGGGPQNHSAWKPGTLPGCTLITIFPSIVKPFDNDSQNPINANKSQRNPPAYSESDFFLLNQFISRTWGTMCISADENTRHIWAQVVPTLSMAHPVLLHSMLAVTAAHLAYTAHAHTHTPTDGVGLEHEQYSLRTDVMELKKLEETHFKAAMNEFGREVLSGVDDLSCHAVFVTSCVVILYLVSPRRNSASIPSLSSSSSSSALNIHPFTLVSSPEPNPLDITWTTFLRSMHGALQNSWTSLSRGPVAVLADNLLPPRTFTHALTPRAESMLARINLLCSDFNILGPESAREMGDRDTASAYYDAVWNVRMCWAVLEWYCASISVDSSQFDEDESDGSPLPVDSAEMLCALFQAVLHTHPRFWERLESASPRALIIYAYYTVCWEAMSYNSGKLPLRLSPTVSLHEAGEQEKDAGQAWHWWTEGRAEADLKCIEAQLDFVARSEYEKGVYKRWIDGAWDVYWRLRRGLWFENEGGVDMCAT